MCGLIAALRPTSDEVLGWMMSRVAHRGLPGRTRIERFGLQALGHARLPIVGVGGEHDQPILRDGVAMAFVGEAHDFRERSPSAECDADVVLDAFRAAGCEALALLDGFWAIAIVDLSRAQAFLITDHLGVKPLYWRPDALLAASEPQALLFDRPPLDAVYLSNVRKWGYDPTGRTPYVGVERVPPGCAVRVDLRTGRWRTQRYFSLEPRRADLREELTLAVRRRLVADVPIALLLSGGLDSTICLALCAELGARATAFHVENDEAEHARVAAARFGVPLKTLALDDASEEDAMAAYGEPVDLGSARPQLALARAIEREGFRVAISGDGADELFGGYRRAAEYDSQASDVFCELPCYHLPRLDRLMMRHRVELRSPYLAPRVVRAALALPWAQRRRKEALRDAFADALPPSIRDREKRPLRAADPTDAARRNRLVDDFVRRYREGDDDAGIPGRS